MVANSTDQEGGSGLEIIAGSPARIYEWVQRAGRLVLKVAFGYVGDW